MEAQVITYSTTHFLGKDMLSINTVTEYGFDKLPDLTFSIVYNLLFQNLTLNV